MCGLPRSEGFVGPRLTSRQLTESGSDGLRHLLGEVFTLRCLENECGLLLLQCQDDLPARQVLYIKVHPSNPTAFVASSVLPGLTLPFNTMEATGCPFPKSYPFYL